MAFTESARGTVNVTLSSTPTNFTATAISDFIRLEWESTQSEFVLQRRGAWDDFAGVPEVENMVLVVNEEFDDFTNISVHGSNDTSMWDIETSTYGTPQRYQRYRHENVDVSPALAGGNGNSLKLTVKNEFHIDRDWTAGMLGTRARGGSRPNGWYGPRFGRYEIKARAHHGHGIWPGFWLRHRDGSNICEVDIMEYFHSNYGPGYTNGVLHRTPNSGSPSPQVNVNPYPRFRYFEDPVAEGLQGWHTWAVDIIPQGDDVLFRWGIDGLFDHEFLDTSALFWKDRYSETNEAFDICLQGAQVGGPYVGHPDDPLGYSRNRHGGGVLGDESGGCIVGGTAPDSCTITQSGLTMRRSEVSEISPGTSSDIIAMEFEYVRVWEWVG